MAKIIVFGAGGRAGRAIVAEAVGRGHEVTAVVRDPGKAEGVGGEVVAGDVTDAPVVAGLVGGQDVVVHAAADLGVPAGEFFPAAARALTAGLGGARLVAIGLASVLETADGTMLMDTPGYPNEYRAFYLGHAAGTEVLKESGADWVVISPSGDFDHTGESGGTYRRAAADAEARITYPDFAVAVLDEIEKPGVRAEHFGVSA
ncbi:NAD(P)-dependent oxidoreductase [Actinocorallia longicatena]|uniref:NAD(P)-dependent oxidoreductase n=1 Tax=Actinocorallia longicatena TaxID=111803 RepID=A0ABP6QC94_9ACTN